MNVSQMIWQATLVMMLKSERSKRGLKKRSIRKGGNRDTVCQSPEMFLLILSSLVFLVLTCSTRIMVKEVFFHVENHLPKDLIFVSSENSLAAYVTHVEPPVTGEVNAQLNSTLPNSSRSDPMLIPSSSTVQCQETSKSKKNQVNPDKAKKKNKLDETKVKLMIL